MKAGEMTDNHDVGGRGSDAPIPRKEHAFLPWEFRVEALREALTDPKRPGAPRMTVDEMRRGIEALTAEEYYNLNFYGKWLRSMIAIFSERNLVERAQIERRAAELAAEHEHEH
jgi:hypothetical protein